MKPVFNPQNLYNLLRTIPKGKVITYKTAAVMLGNPGWARAVGNALHRNPDGEYYPCYKVVNAKGELCNAFVFGGKEEQARRLQKEGIVVENGRVNLEKYAFRGQIEEDISPN